MLQVRGYNGFSYGDVAAELDITRAALHYHFKGKAELGQALIERYAARFAAALADSTPPPPTPPPSCAGTSGSTPTCSAPTGCACAECSPPSTAPCPIRCSRRSCAFFATNTDVAARRSWRRAAPTAASLSRAPPEDTAPMVLGALEGAMLITRLDGDVARFTATTERLLAGLAAAHVPA